MSSTISSPTGTARRAFTLFSTVNGDEDSVSVYRKGDELIFENLCSDIDVFIATDKKKDFINPFFVAKNFQYLYSNSYIYIHIVGYPYIQQESSNQTYVDSIVFHQGLS